MKDQLSAFSWAVRAGLFPYARDLASDALAEAATEREACHHVARLSGLAVRMGQIDEAGQQALSGFHLAERSGCRRLQSQFRLDLAEAALLGADVDSAREQLVLAGNVRDAVLARRTAQLLACVELDGRRPQWLGSEGPAPRQALGRSRTANPDSAEPVLSQALDEVVGQPRPLLALDLAHLCAAAATLADRAGLTAAAATLERLAFIGFRLFGLKPEGPQAEYAREERAAPIWNRIAHWARLYGHLFWKDPSTYFHSIRVAHYARCLCRLTGGSSALQKQAAAAGLLHDIAALSILYDAGHRSRVYQGAVAARIAARLGLPPPVADSLAGLGEWLHGERFEAASPVARAVAIAHAYDELTTGASGLRHERAVGELAHRFGLPEPHIRALHLATAEFDQPRAKRLPPKRQKHPQVRRALAARGTPQGLLATLEQGGLRIVFQPILDLGTMEVHGYEALARGPEGSPIGGADGLFAAAEKAGVRSWLVDLCLQRALELASLRLNPGVRLFLNADLRSLDRLIQPDGPLALALASTGLSASQVVIEVSERQPYEQPRQMRQIRQTLRHLGFSLAMDDFGTAYSCYQQLLALEPEYIKIDLTLVRGLHRDRHRYALIAGLALYGRACGVRLVAEGIETEEELRALRELGVDYGQGYWLAPPAEAPSPFMAARRATT